MDARRLVIATLAALSLGGCAQVARLGLRPAASAPPSARSAAVVTLATAPFASARLATEVVAAPPVQRSAPLATMAPIPNPPAGRTRSRRATQFGAQASAAAARPEASGPAAIAAANSAARERSQVGRFFGGVQVFAYAPGRVYEVWTAPLRVTTLTLAPGEAVVSKAAGDTVRWQIGETASGEGAGRRAHVMIKPLQRGLKTNLVLATSRRIYLIQLRSGAPETFNAEVTWDAGAVLGEPPTTAAAADPAPAFVGPQAPLDARYRIIAKGRRPLWTPTAVATDGVHTFLTFPPGLAAGEAPALFVVGAGGAVQLVNYRQQNGLWVVDRVLDQAELRLGEHRPQVVHIERMGGPS